MGGGRGMSSGTQRELSEELAGRALKSMGVSRCSKEAPEEVHTKQEQGPVCRKRNCLCINGLTEPGIRSECVDGSWEYKKKKA